jgi:hypothetical protein
MMPMESKADDWSSSLGTLGAPLGFWGTAIPAFLLWPEHWLIALVAAFLLGMVGALVLGGVGWLVGWLLGWIVDGIPKE